MTQQTTFRRNYNQSRCSFLAVPLSTGSGQPSQNRNGSQTLNPERTASRFLSSAAAKKVRRDEDREFLISVLESSTTKRDAKAYLQTFGPIVASRGSSKPANVSRVATAIPEGSQAPKGQTPSIVQDLLKQPVADPSGVPHVAVVKLRKPQAWDDSVLNGVAKTLTKLRDLGLISVVVVDCDLNADERADASSWQDLLKQQASRISAAIFRQGGAPGARVVDSAVFRRPGTPVASGGVLAEADPELRFEDTVTSPLHYGQLAVLPSLAFSHEGAIEPVDGNTVTFSLVKFLSGLQFPIPSPHPEEGVAGGGSAASLQTARKALVDRIMVIDPLGGIPSKDETDGADVFINLEEEFEVTEARLATSTTTPAAPEANEKHLQNLRLAKNALAMLPSTSSVVITSPAEAADRHTLRLERGEQDVRALIGGVEIGGVETRRMQNPLIHNLLTDRPIYSSSLPIGRIKPTTQEPEAAAAAAAPWMPLTTLAKKGLPVTIFPDPRSGSWVSPGPGSPRLKLTDNCIDLPRLTHLINDSFNRELDVEHYLRRVDSCLAGIIIAGEYEGGAILTWECPPGLDYETAHATGRLVPYLDKFAVLKKSQGAGGVADIVFNAMVRDCFPGGVCWRSRKNNPVNKWYFERSRGSWKLAASNWAMFWTTPNAHATEQTIKDYEAVCRSVVPSWADNGRAAD